MGANDGPPPDTGKPGDDDWFKEAAARWERQKAEEKLRAEAGTEGAVIEAAPEAAVMQIPAKPEDAAAAREVEDDLRQLARAEAVAVEQRKVEPSALVMAPLEDAAFSVPRVQRPRWWLPAAGGLVLVVGAVVLWPRSPKPATPTAVATTTPAPATAAAPTPATPTPAKTTAPATTTTTPAPKAADPPARPAKKTAKKHPAKHHAKKKSHRSG